MKISQFVPSFILLLAIMISSRSVAQLKTNAPILQKAGKDYARIEKSKFRELLQLSRAKGWKMMITGRNGRIAVLTGVDVLGYPVYVATDNNIRSAATIKTNELWPGGSTGLNLSGSSANVRSKLGVWDGGRVRSSHVELTNRIIQKDNPDGVNNHATHVTGTLVASGVNPLAKGMAFGSQGVVAYDFNDQISEMMDEASDLLVSNHSYGELAGWNFNDTDNRWEFYGEAGSTEDYKFGYYSTEALLYDSIAYNAPYYLIVKSGSNQRNQNGPAVGEPYWRYNEDRQMVSAGNRPDNISSNDGYDIIPTYGTAKNILTIGAVNSLAGGYSQASDVTVANFSGWGPTDDGRIKPDVVANGVNVLSSDGSSDNSYTTLSGTSMASASAAGSVFLLQEYYAKLHNGDFMRSATLKGLVIHTADEAGPDPGPDYKHGWGLINMEKAANVITANNKGKYIYENNLLSGTSYTLPLVASGDGPLVVTVCWTDPKGSVDNVNVLNNTSRKLVNDLDIRIRKGSSTYFPWVLNPAAPASAAVRGVNGRDNVEKVEVADVVPGASYTLEIIHKGTLARGQQAYSLIISGAGGKAYCSSAPASTAGTRIDSVSIGTFTFGQAAGCTGYSDLTQSAAQLEPEQTLALRVKLSSCDGSSASKIVKAFIDYNQDGDFTDANETVATSGVISGNGVFTANITTPAGLFKGDASILRIVAVETGDAASVSACGTYGRGETQDYRIQFVAPSIDLGVTEIVSPEAASCSNRAALVSIRVRNFGSGAKTNVPLSVAIKNGNTTVASLKATFKGIIEPFGEVVYTFQQPFNAAAGTNYTLTASADLAGDQNTANNAHSTNLNISGGSTAPEGSAVICGTQVVLNANPSGNDVFFWYDDPGKTTPIATGSTTTSTVITSDKTYYLAKNDVQAKVGLTDKAAFASGGYNAFDGNFVRFNNALPVVIRSAKLYIGNPGKIDIIVADLINYDPTASSYSYRTISSTTIDAYATTPQPQAGQVENNNPLDTGATFLLNLEVPTTGEHVIIVKCREGATIFRNTNVTGTPYPFSVPGIFSITGNSTINTNDPSDATYFQRFYYFFYNMEVSVSGCPSPRVPILATTATDGCTTPVVDVDGNEIALVASPNPNKGQFKLQFEVKGKDDLNISVLNSLGQRVYTSNYPNFTGKFSEQINMGKISSGMYLLKIEHNRKVFIKKLLIQ